VSAVQARGAEAWVPSEGGVDELRRAARSCEGCDLHEAATQTVFGEGDPHARLLLVGEQPGDVEDREGHPFVGPAGRLLFQVLEELGVARVDVYVTNAVKHFRFTQRGKRRIHEKPSLSHLVACQPWLAAERERLAPDVTVCLGASAMRAVLGAGGTVTERRGKVEDGVLVTIHPSAVLRSDDRASAYAGLKSDLAVAVRSLG
jgi:DNA polymerase